MHNVEEIERPLAQALEGWVLKQAVTGLMRGGQLEQAEALCSQVGNKHTRPRATSIPLRDLYNCRKGWTGNVHRMSTVEHFMGSSCSVRFVQVLNVSPEHPEVMLSLRQVQCQRLLLAGGGTVLPDPVLEQLQNTVMMNPTNVGAWHVSRHSNRFHCPTSI